MGEAQPYLTNVVVMLACKGKFMILAPSFLLQIDLHNSRQPAKIHAASGEAAGHG